MKAIRAFSLVEVMLAMLIMGILGVAVVASMWTMSALFSQTEDYASAQQEIETIFQAVGPQITNAGLGMPNNKIGKGSFADSFRSATPPIMASMGAVGEEWGGPVTIASADSSGGSFVFVEDKTVTLPSGRYIYGGNVLYYAWSIPTGVRIKDVDLHGEAELQNGNRVTFGFVNENADVQKLESFRYGGRVVGIAAQVPLTSKESTRRWIAFATVRVPFWLQGWRKNAVDVANPDGGGNNSATVIMAPESTKPFTRVLSNYEEVLLVQVCRIYLRNGELIQEFSGTGTVWEPNVLAKDIVGLYFTFDPDHRLVTMHVAARGIESDPVGTASAPSNWPSFAPPISTGDQRYRILTGMMTWRIRN
jgi:prepilin-type N-terminal cleavage/methylation domain-containing protein